MKRKQCVQVTPNRIPSSRRYSPGWASASSTTSLRCPLSFIFSTHCLIFIIFKSAKTPSNHLKRGLPFLLSINNLLCNILRDIAPTSILFTWPNHLIHTCVYIYRNGGGTELTRRLFFKKQQFMLKLRLNDKVGGRTKLGKTQRALMYCVLPYRLWVIVCKLSLC